MTGRGHHREEWFRAYTGLIVVAGALALWAGVGTKLVRAQFSPAAGTGPGLPETIEAIDISYENIICRSNT